MAVEQRQFESMTEGQQLFLIVTTLNPAFSMDQRQFESMTRGQQLFQLYDAAVTGGGGGGLPTLGDNYRFNSGVLEMLNPVTGLWQSVQPFGAANAETIEFGPQSS